MIYAVEHALTIEGWMTEQELTWIASVAPLMDSVVEVGTWKGRSAFVWMHQCPGRVHLVDDFERGNVLNDVVKNLYPLRPTLRVVMGDSARSAALFDDQSIDLVFIDAGHNQWEVERDIAAWLPKVRKIICGHDYDNPGYPGVRAAVHSLIGPPHDVCGYIWSRHIL